VPRTSEMRESKFIKQGDVEKPVLWTVTGVERHNVAQEGADPEMKWCLTFSEIDKPLVLNSTNIQLCERAFGSDNTDQWIGRQIVLYVDPNVSYAGKITGGVRVRAPKKLPTTSYVPPVAPPPPAVAELTDDDIPF
jgi:hypothetical protein